jgi:ATP-dependent helicase/nuclease subunit A
MGLTPHQQAAIDYSRHISLTANAGSGKTFVLSKRYLEIALKENIPLRNIAAITFTDKAAGELYKKISSELDRIITGTEDMELSRKAEKIRRQLVSANISTIHSFCIDILREYPVEAQLDANFTPIDQPASDELIEMAVEEIFKEIINIPVECEKLKSLVRLFSSKQKLSTEIASLIRNRKNVLETAVLYNCSPEETAAFFYNSFLQSANKILFPSLDNFLRNINEINKTVLNENIGNRIALEVAIKLKKLNIISPEAMLRDLNSIKELAFTKQGKIRNQGYLGGESREGLQSIIKETENFIKELQYFCLPDNHAETELELAGTGKNIIGFFLKCLDRYELKKKEEGFLDYEDLLICTKRILENGQVQHSLSEKYKYIMVDEYQDTNEIQYRIFLPILYYLKKNNLFVVGDEKQSIYMFRDAELEVFTRTKNDIINESGESSLLNLPDTFRMAPALCLFTNELFRNLFSGPKEAFNEVGYSEIRCARNEGKGSVEILVTSKEKKSEEADLIARRLVNLTAARNYNWGQIAILCRKRKSFAELETAFIKHNIPFSIFGGKGFYQRQSVYDVYNYFSFLLDTRNDAALAGILRSPFFTLSDASLFEISLRSGNSFWNKLKQAAGNTRLSEITRQLEENILLSRNYDLTFLLRKILNESGYYAVLASGSNGEQELANINKLIRLTGNFFSHGYRTLYDYVNFIKDAIENEEDEAQAAVSEESDSVKIMTIHQAKGLEFPVIVVYKADETSKKAAAKSKEITVDKNFGLLTKVPVKNDYFRSYTAAPVVNLSAFINERKHLAEIKRLFYVAVTRAMDMLIISTVLPDRQKNETFTGLLQKGLDLDFTAREFNISSKLNFLQEVNGKFINTEKTINLNIPVISEIKEIVYASEPVENVQKEMKFDLSVIEDLSEGEIISATKYSVYKECPVKYNLIYEYGFNELYNTSLIKRSEDLPADDEDTDSSENMQQRGKRFANIKGSIIHTILQQEITASELETRGGKIAQKELDILNLSGEEKGLFTRDIIGDVSAYFNTSLYKEIKSYPVFYNEYNVYLRENDYFLYGIIDKLIISGNKGIIVDYKTDDIPESEIPKRSVKYFNQLKFYSYIIKSAFKNLAELELRLIFLKHPELKISLVMDCKEIEKTGADIPVMIQHIRNNKFIKNYSHCSSCYFSINKSNCIIT